MKKNNKKNSRLKYLLILLLLTAIIFGSSTYAWFTTNRVVTVSSIDVHVDAVDGIQISADGINWKASIDKADLLEVLSSAYTDAPNTIPAKLEPVSTGLNFDTTAETAGLLEMYYGNVQTNETSGEYELFATKNSITDADVYYIVFDIFLKTTAEIEKLYLTTDSGASCVGTSVGLENATRIAMIKQGNIEAGSEKEDIQALFTTAESNIYLWEPNYLSHTPASKANASSIYNISLETYPEQDYAGVIDTITSGIELVDCNETENALKFKDVTPTYQTENGFGSNLEIFGLEPGITKVRVYMWIEGQDIDCENSASGTDVKFDLKFTIDQ